MNPTHYRTPWRQAICTLAMVWALLLANFSNAIAAEKTVQDAIPFTKTNWTDTLSFDKFDPDLGTLTSVEVTLSGSVKGNARYERTDNTPDDTTITLNLSANIQLARPNNAGLLEGTPVAQESESAAPFDGVVDYDGPSGSIFPNLTATATDNATLTSAADLALFTGTGQLVLPVQATGTSTTNSRGANIQALFNVDASADVTVKYTYTPKVVGPKPAIRLIKTVYEGHNSGATCPANQIDLVKAAVGTLITYCFTITNTGDTHLDPVTLIDGDLGINQSSAGVVKLSGSVPLAPGASLVYYYETRLLADLDNRADTEGTPSDDGGNPLPGLNTVQDGDTAKVRIPLDGTVTICKEDSQQNKLSGWTINLSGADTLSGVTDATGCVTFALSIGGSYTANEVLQPGWKQVMPPNNGSFTFVLNRNNLSHGPFTFVNRRDSLIRVCKVDDRSGLPLENWELNLSGPETGQRLTGKNGCTNFTVAVGGTYTLSETLQPGWSQVFPVNPNTFGVNVTVGQDYGFNREYIFRNRSNNGISVIKVATPADGTNFTYTTTLSPTTFLLDDAAIDDSDGITRVIGFANVLSGTYTISEHLPTGWALSGFACAGGLPGNTGMLTGTLATLHISDGENLTCTFTNTVGGRLLIKKETIPPGHAQSFDFNTIGANSGPFALQHGGLFTLTNVPANSPITIVETPVAGWSLTSSECDNGQSATSVSVPSGQTVTCTFVNEQRGQLRVIKVVENDFGGTAQPSDFILYTYQNNVLLRSFNGSTTGVTVTLDVGNYHVTELAVLGYVASYSADCAGSIQPGTLKVCTVTNRETPPSITVIKQATPADGTDFNFNGGLGAFTLDDAQVDDGDSVTSTRTFTNVTPGNVAITETLPAGWQLVSAGCTGGLGNDSTSLNGTTHTLNVDVDKGEFLVCTFVNQRLPRITMIKQVVNDNGGGAGANDFGLSVNGTVVTSGVPIDVVAGVPLVLDEAGRPDYQFVSITGAGRPTTLGGSVTLQSGAVITCTITNDDLPGVRIAVGDRVFEDKNKNGLQDDGPTSGVPGITVTLLTGDGNPTGKSTITGPNGNYLFGDLPPGKYIVQFSAPPGFIFAAPNQGGTDEGSDADVQNGRTISFTVPLGTTDNTRDAGLIKVPNIIVEKQVGPGDAAPGSTLIYTIMYENAGEIAANGLEIEEVVPAFTVFLPDESTPGWQCEGGKLSAGTICIFKVNTLPPQGQGTLAFSVQVDPLLLPTEGVFIVNEACAVMTNGPQQCNEVKKIIVGAPTALDESTEPSVPTRRIFLPFIEQ